MKPSESTMPSDETPIAVASPDGPPSAKSPTTGRGILGIVLLSVLAHAPAFRAGFLWDDEFWLWKSPLTLANDGIWRAWFSADRYDFYPVTSSAFWMMWRAFGENPAGYHAVNVLLHAGGAALVWLVLRRLGAPGAWAAAALFAVHPVTVGTVAWITQIKNTLSLVFYAAALLAWLRAVDAPPNGRRRWYTAALLAFAAALLSKSSVVVLPIVLVAVAWWRRGRVVPVDLRATVPFFALALAQGAATVWFQANRAFGATAGVEESFAVRLAAAGGALLFYARQALAPTNLAIIYPKVTPDVGSMVAWWPWIVVAAGLAAAFFCRRALGRAPLFALVVYGVTLGPVLGFVDMYYVRYSRVADHWQYLALPALLALVVGAVATALRRLAAPRAAAITLAVLVLAAASTVSFRQAVVYRNHGTFWWHVLAHDPESWVAWNGMGMWAGRQGDHETSATHFARAIELWPEYALAHRNLGRAHEHLADPERAAASYRRAIELRPDYVEAHASIGVLLSQGGDPAEGAEHLAEAVRLQPRHTRARYNLALARLATGDAEAAEAELREAIRLRPAFLEARYELSRMLVGRGDLAGARDQLRAIVDRNAQYQEAAAALAAVEQALRESGEESPR